MRRWLWVVVLLGSSLRGTSAASAQEVLSLAEALAAAADANPAVRAGRASEAEAGARAHQAAAMWLPRVDLLESWQRGDMPVYVFGALLSQRRFTEANFAVDMLNHPDPLTNRRTSLSVAQPIFSTEALAASRRAGVARQIAVTRRESVERDVVLEAATAYGRALVAQSAVRAAAAAVAAADDDLRRTRDRQAAGLVTDADVLSVQVHAAQMRARAIDAEAEVRIALGELNRAMGRPLDRAYVLAPASPAESGAPIAALETEALAVRPEARRAALEQRLAEVDRDAARLALLPQVSWQGGYEWNGQSFARRSRSWILGAEVRLNLFRGFADRARSIETARAVERAAAERDAIVAAVRQEVRAAALRREAARARLEVGRTAVAQARESQRIVRDRYDNGLATVGDVLRAAQAVLEAETQQATAEADTLISTAALERAVGR